MSEADLYSVAGYPESMLDMGKKDNKVMKLPRPDYYQGILQLRDVGDEVIAFVHNQVRKRPDAAITKTVRIASGFDYYITSQKFIRILGKKLKESFGGELKVSSKLHTKDRHGKLVYRVNVLFRPSKYRAGDIVSVRGNKVRLIGVHKKIFGRDLRTGRKLVIRREDLCEAD